MTEPLRVLSLGAGVQSTTLALMAAHGEVGPMPDFAVFADTGGESSAVYDHLEWLRSANVLPFPVIVARREGPSLADLTLAVVNGERPRSGATLPGFWVKDPDGMMPFQCSKDFKTRVVARVIREHLGLAPGQRGPRGKAVEQWLGIDAGEMQRMKDAEQSFIQNRWPLIEKNMRRHDCLKWMERNGYPRPPRSSCVFCPFRSGVEWRELKDNDPEGWGRAVAFDEAIRGGFPGMKGSAFVHLSRVPLVDADLSTDAERGQIEFGFLQDCEGACGS